MQLLLPLVQWRLSTAVAGSVGIERVLLFYNNGICDLQMSFPHEGSEEKGTRLEEMATTHRKPSLIFRLLPWPGLGALAGPEHPDQ